MDIQPVAGRKFIYVTFQRKGFHYYPGAPEQVKYLELKHRHLFKFKVTIQVFHEEREIEFHMFQDFLEGQYNAGLLELDGKSCETIANDLARRIQDIYGPRAPNDRYLQVEVSEDGECGAICEYWVKANV